MYTNDKYERLGRSTHSLKLSVLLNSNTRLLRGLSFINGPVKIRNNYIFCNNRKNRKNLSNQKFSTRSEFRKIQN